MKRCYEQAYICTLDVPRSELCNILFSTGKDCPCKISAPSIHPVIRLSLRVCYDYSLHSCSRSSLLSQFISGFKIAHICLPLLRCLPSVTCLLLHCYGLLLNAHDNLHLLLTWVHVHLVITHLTDIVWSCCISVSIVYDYIQTGRLGFDPRQRQKIFPLASVSRPAPRPTKPPIQWVLRLFTRG
jgi:hypothetical protein